MGPKGSVSYVKISAKAAYQLANGEVTHRDIVATEIKLDAYPTNQYLFNQFLVSDFPALAIQKITLDALGITEEQSISVAKSVVDSVGFSDAISILLTIERSTVDLLTIADVAVIVLDKSISETINLSESQQIHLAQAKTEAISLSDIYSSLVAKLASDSVSITDSLERAVTYTRNLTDAFGFSEIFNLTPNIGVQKTNVFSLTENFSYQIRPGFTSALNTAALNTYYLNA